MLLLPKNRTHPHPNKKKRLQPLEIKAQLINGAEGRTRTGTSVAHYTMLILLEFFDAS